MNLNLIFSISSFLHSFTRCEVSKSKLIMRFGKGCFLSSKKTVTRLFWGFSFANISMKTWCSSRLKLLTVAKMVSSFHYRESLTWLLNTSEFLTYEKNPRVLTVKQNAPTWVNEHWWLRGCLNLLIMMICYHVKKRPKGLCLSCGFWSVGRRMER